MTSDPIPAPRARARRIGLLLVTSWLLAACVSRVDGTPPFELVVGDCFDDKWLAPDEGSRVLRVEILSCDEPHQKEVTALIPVGGDDRPGREVFEDVIEVECDAALTGYAGTDVDGLEATGRFPSNNSWDLGYRWVICFVQAADGSLLEASVVEGAGTVDTDSAR